MKKYWRISFLLLILLVIAGCSTNKVSKNVEKQTADTSDMVYEENDDENIKTQSISEHFTDGLTNEEIWFEVSVDSTNDISPTAHITALLLTDEGYHDTGYGEAFGARGLMGDGGYIYIRLNNNDETNNPQVIDLYKHFVNDTLKQIIYQNYLETSIVNNRKRVLGNTYEPQISKELRHQIVLDNDSKIKYQRLIFKGEETYRTVSSNSTQVKYIFNIKEDSVIIPMSSMSYPTAYLVGVKGTNMNDDYEDKFFVKFSNEKEKYIFDALYTDANVETVTEDD